jgi:endonuclease III
LTTQQRYKQILAWFQANFPEAQSELNFANNFQLLVAVVLSAQCTDKRVNAITPALFERFPTIESMAEADIADIYEMIRSVSYPNSKAAYLKGIAEKILNDFGGEVPSNIDQLQTLPGVGRKTANVVTAVAFGQPRMAVDTHVFRISERLGLTTNSRTPLQTELTLTKHIPQELIPNAHHWLLLHGRYICTARKPKCNECGLKDFCRKYEKNEELGVRS